MQVRSQPKRARPNGAMTHACKTLAFCVGFPRRFAPQENPENLHHHPYPETRHIEKGRVRDGKTPNPFLMQIRVILEHREVAFHKGVYIRVGIGDGQELGTQGLGNLISPFKQDQA